MLELGLFGIEADFACALAVAIDQKQRCGMVDRIIRLGIADGFIEHVKLLGRAGDIGSAARQTCDGDRKGTEIAFQRFGRVAFGIERHKQDAQVVKRRANPFAHDRQLLHRHRTDIGALGKAKKHRDRLAFQRGKIERLAVCIGQREFDGRPQRRISRQLFRNGRIFFMRRIIKIGAP